MAASIPDTLVIIPTYNEAGNLEQLVTGILELDKAFSVLVVDDESPDGTGDLADRIANTHAGRVLVLRRTHKQGIGPAYLAGFARALRTDAALIATMDGDRSHEPIDLMKLVLAAGSADLVLGSRYVRGGSTQGWPIHRRLLSRIGGWYARTILGVPIHDLTGGFKVYRRTTLERIDLTRIRSDGYVFQIETTFRTLQSGCHVVEVPIQFVDRVSGTSKLSRTIVLEAVWMVWKLRIDDLLSRTERRSSTCLDQD